MNPEPKEYTELTPQGPQYRDRSDDNQIYKKMLYVITNVADGADHWRDANGEVQWASEHARRILAEIKIANL